MATYSSSINKTSEELVNRPKASVPPAMNATDTAMFMATVTATLRPGDASESGATDTNTTGSTNKPLPAGTAAGIAVGACAGLALLGVAVAWIIRRRKKRNQGGADDLDIQPYEFTTPKAGGSAGGSADEGVVNSGFSEAGMSDGTGHHVEKDGQPIQCPALSPTAEKVGQPMPSPIQAPRPGTNHTVYEMA